MISGRVGRARVERLRAYYSEEAQRLVTDAKSHLDMGRTYEKQALTFEAKHPYGTLGVSHCEYWPDLDLRQAKEAAALAARQEMAKAAEQKQ